jgi:hypothetical protein
MAANRSTVISEPTSDLGEVPALTGSATDGDVVVKLGTAVAAGDGSAQPQDQEPLLAPEAPAFGRFRRRLERFKGVSDTDISSGSIDDESELRLQVMLLREENARLKAARHQPASAGSAIDNVRLLNSQASDGETLDDAWSVLSECLVVREGLDQACAEIQKAISGVRDRLEALTVTIDSALADQSISDAAGHVAR